MYLFIYKYVCLHMNCTRKCTPYASPITSAHCSLCFPGHWLLFAAPLWELALSIGMAYSASSAEDSPDDDSNLSRTRTTTGHKKRLDDDSDLGSTHTAIRHRKHSSGQTATQREKDWHANDFCIFLSSIYIISLLSVHTFTLFAYPFFVITHLSNA